MTEHGFADLHVHTTASDGTDTLAERCAQAQAVGLPAFAVTDHDSLHPALSKPVIKYEQCHVISGAEIRAGVEGHEIELLGLFLNPQASDLQDVLARVQQHRIDRNQAIVEALRTQTEFETTYDTLARRCDGVLTRPHLAEQLQREGVVDTHREAFQQYLNSGRSTHEPLQLVDCATVISAIHAAGGIASLAHPGYFQPSESDEMFDSLRSLVERLHAAGLDAIEVSYEYGDFGFSAPQAATIATNLELLHTGGSDCHGLGTSATQIGDVRVSQPAFRRLSHKADIQLPRPLS